MTVVIAIMFDSNEEGRLPMYGQIIFRLYPKTKWPSFCRQWHIITLKTNYYQGDQKMYHAKNVG